MGGNDIINNDLIDDYYHCILFYEDFINNHDYILNKLELFLHL